MQRRKEEEQRKKRAEQGKILVSSGDSVLVRRYLGLATALTLPFDLVAASWETAMRCFSAPESAATTPAAAEQAGPRPGFGGAAGGTAAITTIGSSEVAGVTSIPGLSANPYVNNTSIDGGACWATARPEPPGRSCTTRDPRQYRGLSRRWRLSVTGQRRVHLRDGGRQGRDQQWRRHGQVAGTIIGSTSASIWRTAAPGRQLGRDRGQRRRRGRPRISAAPAASRGAGGTGIVLVAGRQHRQQRRDRRRPGRRRRRLQPLPQLLRQLRRHRQGRAGPGRWHRPRPQAGSVWQQRGTSPAARAARAPRASAVGRAGSVAPASTHHWAAASATAARSSAARVPPAAALAPSLRGAACGGGGGGGIVLAPGREHRQWRLIAMASSSQAFSSPLDAVAGGISTGIHASLGGAASADNGRPDRRRPRRRRQHRYRYRWRRRGRRSRHRPVAGRQHR